VTLKSRLMRLSRDLRPELCPECRDRSGRIALVVDVEEVPDETVAALFGDQSEGA
jgi:hypothetical protein